MPPEAAPANPGDRIPFADVLVNVGKPSLSATSDEPVIDLAKPQEAVVEEPVDNTVKPADTADTSAKPEGEADAPPAEAGKESGEGKDATSPQDRAVITRFKNRAKAAEQAAAEVRTQLSQLAEQVAKLVGERDQPKDDPRPARDAFTDPDAYDQALVDWSGRQASAKAMAEAQQQQTQAERERQFESLRTTFSERAATFEADHPDYEDVVYADDVKISAVMSQALMEAEDGPAIAYYLGQNPEVAERINGLTPARQVYEIGKISAKLSAPPPPKPAPIKPLAARNNAGPKDPNEMSMEEWAVASPNARKTKAN